MNLLKLILVPVIGMTLIIGGGTYAVMSLIDSAGEVKHIITEAGKEIKDIAADIEAHEPHISK